MGGPRLGPKERIELGYFVPPVISTTQGNMTSFLFA